MRGWGRGAVAGTIAAIAALAFVVPQASAAPEITAESECCSFVQVPFVQNPGETPNFVNPIVADARHNVAAFDPGPDGGALFRSATILPGDTTPVRGTEYLPAGTYPFFCTLHGPSMSGELVIQPGEGSALPRPRIDVVVPAQPLRAVRRSGRLRVRVRAFTDSPSVTLRVSRGRTTVGVKRGISLLAGSSKTVVVILTRSGRRAISKGRRVPLAVRAGVEFGRPDAARRTLR